MFKIYINEFKLSAGEEREREREETYKREGVALWFIQDSDVECNIN